jgi:protein-L-isoaspartate(D-aspartate) O-methyltransferase
MTKQLKPGGKTAIPVGEPHGFQELILVTKNEQGEIREKPVLSVAFVPMIYDDNIESTY